MKLAHQSFAEFVHYFSPSRLRFSIAPSSEVWQYAERREREEERGQIAYDNPGKTTREIIPVGTKRKHLHAGYDISKRLEYDNEVYL